MDNPHKIHPAVASLIVVTLLTVGTVGVMSLSGGDAGSPEAPVANDSSSRSNTQTSNTQIRSGVYETQGSYRTPGGTESIGVTVTLEDGVIKDIDLEQRASGGDTEIYQAKFASGYKPLVIGKKIDDVKLSRVAGSSLTSNGFNDALKQIKIDASS